MANKTPGNQGSSGEADGSAPRVSRKVIGKASAPYERKAEDGGEEKKPASEGQPPEQGEKAEAAAGDTGKFEATKSAGKDARKDQGGRKDSRDGARPAETPAATATPAAPAAPATTAAPAAASETPAAASEPASVPPAAPPRPAPAGDFAPPPDLDTTAEFAELIPPRFIQNWDPNTPAPAPAKAPPGDSRSFRRRQDGVEEFVLIYRAQTFLVRRSGRVGVLGTWTMTEYPHVGAAAHAYAQQCSELSAAGFRDLR
jgi:hypothetical protein